MPTTVSSIDTVKLRLFEGSREIKSAAHGLIDVLPFHPFHILASSFSAKSMHVFKHMVMAYITGLQTSVMTAQATDSHQSAMKTPESVDQSAFSDVRPAFCEERNIFAHREAQKGTQKPTNNRDILAAAVHYEPKIYKPKIYRKFQRKEYVSRLPPQSALQRIGKTKSRSPHRTSQRNSLF